VKNRTLFVIITVVVSIALFLLGPNAPLGAFWALHPENETPIGVQLPLFILLSVFEAFAAGIGIAFLILGYPLAEAAAPASKGLTRAAHLSTSWLLINWWLHDNLHIVNGPRLNGLLAIEYGFHVTLMIAGVILAAFLSTILRPRRAEETLS
jgi:hypothetical protein